MLALVHFFQTMTSEPSKLHLPLTSHICMTSVLYHVPELGSDYCVCAFVEVPKPVLSRLKHLTMFSVRQMLHLSYYPAAHAFLILLHVGAIFWKYDFLI